MNIFPKIYTKTEFLELLITNNINDNIIHKFNKLPEHIEINKSTYFIYINVTQYGVKNPTFNYELNYYSNDLIEFLFNSKVFSRIELSVNKLLCGLMNIKLININEIQ
jgi:hypothetical protein